MGVPRLTPGGRIGARARLEGIVILEGREGVRIQGQEKG